MLKYNMLADVQVGAQLAQIFTYCTRRRDVRMASIELRPVNLGSLGAERWHISDTSRIVRSSKISQPVSVALSHHYNQQHDVQSPPRFRPRRQPPRSDYCVADLRTRGWVEIQTVVWSKQQCVRQRPPGVLQRTFLQYPQWALSRVPGHRRRLPDWRPLLRRAHLQRPVWQMQLSSQGLSSSVSRQAPQRRQSREQTRHMYLQLD
ncbi:hypothetical protein DFH08DRAFT_870829 [Mycena albidolilacea]|uniref:Uncharacterized protein n=1 Tax=Mycena albidolilacea TaxID=1033008 RepID=A0AAD7A061_9AGAR|nr:hypothetical protein DFH08DRAFT_870829 [Mycena albidolilacea]